VSAGTIDAIERLLAEAEDADDALRAALSTLVEEPEIVWAGIAFVEEGAIALGPTAGTPDERGRVRIPVVFQRALVGELWVDGTADPALLEQVAGSLAPHVLIGWDTRGETWEP
jgi:putative methionine-R-sulfoxide reductase with GAF domain